MKKARLSLASLLLSLMLLLSLLACNTVSAEGKWENATYRRDKSFGSGETTVTVTVKVEEESVTFTLKTDKETLADALLEHGLIEGEDAGYGIYIKKVNGITADYSLDGSWWGVEQDGKPTSVGASSLTLKDGDHYDLVYSK